MNKLNFKNKKAEKYLSVYWFAVLCIVAVGIAMIVAIFYGKPLDVRQIESQIIVNKIADCISFSDTEVLREDINNENFFEKCNFAFNENEKEEYYLEVLDLEISKGNNNLKTFCSIKEKSVVCLEKNLYVKSNVDGENKFVKILAVVRKTEKNA